MTLLPTPAESSGAQDKGGNRAAFLWDTFLWPRKEKYLARGCENPHSNKLSRSDSFSTTNSDIAFFCGIAWRPYSRAPQTFRR